MGGGAAWPYHVEWQVAPALKASPSTLVVDQSKGHSEFEVIVRSAGGPFRVTGVRGGLLSGDASYPPEPARSNKVRLSLDATRGLGDADPDVVIVTDDPGQSAVHVKVVVQPSNGEKNHVASP